MSLGKNNLMSLKDLGDVSEVLVGNETTGVGSSCPKFPTIEVAWDYAAQVVGLKFKPEEFKTWDFIIAVLGMAIETARTNKKLGELRQMQAMAEEQQRTQQIAARIHRGR